MKTVKSVIQNKNVYYVNRVTHYSNKKELILVVNVYRNAPKVKATGIINVNNVKIARAVIYVHNIHVTNVLKATLNIIINV